MPSREPDREQMLMLPPCVDDWVLENHPARFIRNFVKSMDLEELGFKMPAIEGRPSYDSEMLLGVWIYGLMEGIRSSRKLEKGLYDSIGLIWISFNQKPDHNTLWRFCRNNRECMKKVLRETVHLAIENNLVGFELQAVDGTKILANASNDRTITQKRLAVRIKEIDREIGRIMKEVEENDEKDDSEGKGGYGLPQELEKKQKLKKDMEESLKRLKGENKKEENRTDKDSRFMKTNRGVNQAYNAQAVVDSKTQIIVGEDVVNHSSDTCQLTRMIAEAESNTGVEAKETLADMGYYSPEELAKAEENGKKVVVNLPDLEKAGRYDKSAFKYDEKNDEYECQWGGRLECFAGKKNKRGKDVKMYRCRVYKECKHLLECTKDKRGRTIEVTKDEAVIRAIKQKSKEENWSERLKVRGRIIEPVFGVIKEVLGMRRFSCRGLEKVRVEWSTTCAIINLRKIMKYRWPKFGVVRFSG